MIGHLPKIAMRLLVWLTVVQALMQEFQMQRSAWRAWECDPSLEKVLLTNHQLHSVDKAPSQAPSIVARWKAISIAVLGIALNRR